MTLPALLRPVMQREVTEAGKRVLFIPVSHVVGKQRTLLGL